MFRVEGNVTLPDTSNHSNKNYNNEQHPFILNVGELKKKCRISFVQYLKPLTRSSPFFSVKIIEQQNPTECNVTLGIAGPEISEHATPGLWNNTVGYESQSGRCLSSHRSAANTFGRSVKIGDTFGLMVTHFGSQQSTCVFVLNGEPVATRYHFETDLNKFLPTVAFDSSCRVETNWPHESLELPSFFSNNKNSNSNHSLLTWIKPDDTACAHSVGEFSQFENIQNTEDMPVQAPLALSKQFCHYKCTQLDVVSVGGGNDKKGASVGLASCSPLKPTPTSSLLRDYYTWLPHMKRNLDSLYTTQYIYIYIYIYG